MPNKLIDYSFCHNHIPEREERALFDIPRKLILALILSAAS